MENRFNFSDFEGLEQEVGKKPKSKSNLNLSDFGQLEQEVTSAKVEREIPDIAGFAKEQALALPDTILALGSAPIGWSMGKTWGLANILAGTILGEDPEETRRIAEESEAELAGKFYQPQTEIGQKAVGMVGDLIEGVLNPLKQAASLEGDIYKPLGIENIKSSHPRAGYVLDYLFELAVFGAAHGVGNIAKSKIKKLIEKAKEPKRTSQNTLDDIKSLEEELGLKGENLENPKARRAVGEKHIFLDGLRKEHNLIQKKIKEGKFKKPEQKQKLKERLAEIQSIKEKYLPTPKPPQSIMQQKVSTESPAVGPGIKPEIKLPETKPVELKEPLPIEPKPKPVEPKPKPFELKRRAQFKPKELEEAMIGEVKPVELPNVPLRPKAVEPTGFVEGGLRPFDLAKVLEGRKPEPIDFAGLMEKAKKVIPKIEKPKVVKPKLKPNVVKPKLKPKPKTPDFKDVEIPEFKGSAEAISFGKDATIEQVAKLQKMNDACRIKTREVKERAKTEKISMEELQEMQNIAAKANLYQEAITSYEKGGDYGLKPKPKVKTVSKLKPKKTSEFENKETAEASDFELVTNKSFVREAKAREAMLKNETLIEKQKELEKIGSELEVVKVKGRFRFARNLKLTGKGQEILNKKGKKADPKKIDAELRKLIPEIKEWTKNPEKHNVANIEGKIRSLSDGLPVGDARFSDILTASDKMLSHLKKEQNKHLVKDTGAEIKPHPIKYKADLGVSVIKKQGGKPFKNVFEALDIIDKYGLKGRVEADPSAKGLADRWVIEIGEAKPKTKATPKEIKAANIASVRTATEIIGDLKKSFGNEKGSIDFSKASPEKIEALRRIILDARRAGKKMSEFLTQLGYSKKMADAFEKAARELEKLQDVEKPKINNFESGKVVSIKQNKMVDGIEVRHLPIHEGVLKILQESEVLKPKAYEKVREAFRNPIRVFEAAHKDFINLVLRPYWKAEKAFLREWKLEVNDIKKLRKGLGRKARQRIMAYAIGNQTTGKTILKEMRIKEVKELRGRELEVYNVLRAKYQNLYSRLNEMRTSIGQNPIREVDNYFTFFQSMPLMERLGLKVNPIFDSNRTIHSRYAKFLATPFRFAHHRTVKARGKKALEMDPFFVYTKYAESGIRHIHISPIVAYVGELRGKLIDPNTGKIFKLKEKNPIFDKFLFDWANDLAGKDRLSLGPMADRFIQSQSNNLTLAVMSANLRTAAIQVTALRNTHAMVGTYHTVKGTIALFNPEKIKEIMNRSDVIEQRQYDAAISDVMSSIASGNIGELKKIVGKAGLFPLKYLDLITAMASNEAAYSYAKASKTRSVGRGLGMSKNAAAEFADVITNKTQASSMKGDLSPIQRTTVGKALTLFQTFVINDFNLFMKDVIGRGNKNVTKKMVAERLTRYVFATSLISHLYEDKLGIKSPFPRPLLATKKGLEARNNPVMIALDVAMELVETIPVVGSVRFGSTMLGPIAELISEISDRLSSDDFDPLNPTLADWALLGKLRGYPGTGQIIKGIRAQRRGETPYGIAVGRYRER